MSWNIPRTVAVLVLCTTLVAPQTFQYSRGWTNGRKRGGVGAMPITRVDHDAMVPGIIVGPLIIPRTGFRGMAALFGDTASINTPVVWQRVPTLNAAPTAAAASADSMQRYRDVISARAPPQPAQEWKEDEGIERRRRETEGVVTSTTSSET